jgi:uncharacterized protein (DUF1778 family)
MPAERTPRQLKIRTSPLSVSFSLPERDLVVRAADTQGDTVSGFIREAAVKAAIRKLNAASRAEAA